MDDKLNNEEQELTIEIDETNNYQKLDSKEAIYEIEIRMQEIDALLERYEDALVEKEEEILTHDEVSSLKQEYKDLRKRKKELSKKGSKTKWDQMPIWMFFYGAFQFIFSFFYVLMIISIHFAQWFINSFNINLNEFWKYFSFLFIPVISLIISLVILLLIKDKTRKRFFLYIYLIQIFESAISIFFMIRTMLSL